MILQLLLLSLLVTSCFSQEKVTLSIEEFENKLNKLNISGFSADSVKSEKLFPNLYDASKDKYLTGRSADGKLTLLLPKFFPSYFVRDFVSKQQFSDADSLKKQIESTKAYLENLSNNYEEKPFTCSLSLVAKVLSDNFDVNGEDDKAVLMYSPNPNRTFSSANLLTKCPYNNSMFLFFPKDLKLDSIFAEAISREYDANAHQSFVDFVFEKASTVPTENKVDLASLLQEFNKYSLVDKKFAINPTASPIEFKDNLFHAKNADKVFIQIEHFWKSQELTDYNALLVKFLCMARKESMYAAKQNAKLELKTDLNSGYMYMFLKIFDQYLCKGDDFKEFFTTLEEYSISFDDFDKLINQELQTKAMLNFSGLVSKSEAFKDTTKTFYIDGNNACFTGTGATLDSLDKFLSTAKQSFYPKGSTNSERVEEFLVHLQAVTVTTPTQGKESSGKTPGKTPGKSESNTIIKWCLLGFSLLLVAIFIFIGFNLFSRKNSEKNSI